MNTLRLIPIALFVAGLGSAASAAPLVPAAFATAEASLRAEMAQHPQAARAALARLAMLRADAEAARHVQGGALSGAQEKRILAKLAGIANAAR